MAIGAERALRALRLLLRFSHLSTADDLPELVAQAGSELEAERSVLYLVDYDQVLLVPLTPPLAAASTVKPEQPLPIEATLAGRAFSDVVHHTTSTEHGWVLWMPVLDGTERIGLIRLDFSSDIDCSEELLAACRDVAALLAEMVLTRALYGDLIERARRRNLITIPAEMQWRLLPPLTFVTARVAIAGALAPTAEIAGDSFDYAVNGDTAHVAIIDAMGHGMEAALLSAVAISALRNARRGWLDLAGTVEVMDAEIASQFGPDKFVTAVVGELDLSTGWWRWTACGHPPALIVRGGRVVKTLDALVGAPLGLGLLQEPEIAEERLEPGDRLLLYTDGVIEARNAAGEFFGTDRLVEFVCRQASSGRPAAETLRRLNHAILAHQEGTLQDDATTVMVEWLTDEPARNTHL